MNFLQDVLKNLPQAAQSPIAFLAYLGVIITWGIIAWRVKRNKQLLEKIRDFPDEQKLAVVTAEMGTPIPPNLSPEQWLRSRRQSYLFYGFVALCMAGELFQNLLERYENLDVSETCGGYRT
jgi:hypothetical protein